VHYQTALHAADQGRLVIQFEQQFVLLRVVGELVVAFVREEALAAFVSGKQPQHLLLVRVVVDLHEFFLISDQNLLLRNDAREPAKNKYSWLFEGKTV
jgi:hypothetical protein